ncbi:hypothetical protein FQR65_LT00994 [Abscondita terminalis]|nr:hypothetical protein FQR65_LT00994 [Abscondita terminalis]
MLPDSSWDFPAMDKNKKCLIISILRFLQDEAQSGNSDKKESLEVAIQCIESAFDVNLRRSGSEYLQNESLLTMFSRSFPVEKEKLTAATISTAEAFKNKGNELMRNGLYKEAVEQYTRAIQLNADNAIYYCNRAAAFSRLENHENVIEDCECAVRLDPTYGKAYGRLGIAYSNLNMFKKARDAYVKALELDPTNAMYQENLKLAEERIIGTSGAERNVDINQVMTHPTWLNMASQMLNDPSVRDVMTGILQMGNEGGNPNIDALLNMGQQLAEQMQLNNPTFVDSLRRQFAGDRETSGNASTNTGDSSDGNSPPTKDDDPSSL